MNDDAENVTDGCVEDVPMSNVAKVYNDQVTELPMWTSCNQVSSLS